MLRRARSDLGGRRLEVRAVAWMRPSSRTPLAAATGAIPAERVGHQVGERQALQLEVDGAGLGAAQLEEVVDERGELVGLVAERWRGSARCRRVRRPPRPRSASAIARMPARGVRRSWETQATSSRRDCSRALAPARVVEPLRGAVELGARRSSSALLDRVV